MTTRDIDQRFQTFLEKHPVRTFKKGEIIIFQGEAPRVAFVVKRGIVKAYNLSVGGDEKPVGFYEAGAIFPAAWVYGKMPNAIYYYEAFTPEISLYAINRSELVKFIKSSPDLVYKEMERYLVEEVGQSMRLNALQHSRASDKLLYTLHYLALSNGHKVAPQEVEIDLTLTHQDFANLTGLTRETAATELNKLKHKGVIHYDKHKPYRLNLTALVQLLNDQYISDVKISF